MKTRHILITLLFCTLMACQSKADSGFVGTWDLISGQAPRRVQIVYEGGHYILRVDGQVAQFTYVDGKLSLMGGLSTTTYVKETDHIVLQNLAGTAEYMRAK